MSKKKAVSTDNIPPSGGQIQEVSFQDALKERYLSYALSTISSRSLPDVRDGLKPVQRRIIYAMYEGGNTASKPFRKSADALGNVMRKYHPHGDTPIYEALVRMAQDFSSRYPLIEGQGNFGSIDGDGPAAFRYTEARLSPYGEAMLRGIEEDAVLFRPTATSNGEEPVVLPGPVPNLLCNGSAGVAVGMATNIPPHNLKEVIQGALVLLENPEATTKKIMSKIKGPDFPTGGTLIDAKSHIENVYETGRGSLKVRAKWDVEKQKGGAYEIIITEIPFQTQKSRLVARIAELLEEKKLPLLGDIRDESEEHIRLVLVPRARTVQPEHLMASLFQATDLELSFGVNLNVLTKDTVPQVMGIRGLLQAFLNHRREVLVRRAQYRLEKIAERLHILEGLLLIFNHLDEIIHIIRTSDDPKSKLMERFPLSQIQAEAILNTRLRALRKLEEEALDAEQKDLLKTQKELKTLVADAGLQSQKMAEDLEEMVKTFGDKRRTVIEEAESVSLTAEVLNQVKEPVTILVSPKAWVKVVKGHEADKHEGSEEWVFALNAYTNQRLHLIEPQGYVFSLAVGELPGGRSQGEPLGLLLKAGREITPLAMWLPKPKAPEEEPEEQWFVATHKGRGFRVEASNLVTQTRAGKRLVNLDAGDELIVFERVEGSHVATVGENRRMLIFAVEEVPLVNRGKGVILQRFKDGGLSDAKIFSMNEGKLWRGQSISLDEKDLAPWMAHRASQGRFAPPGFPRSNKFNAVIAK